MYANHINCCSFSQSVYKKCLSLSGKGREYKMIAGIDRKYCISIYLFRIKTSLKNVVLPAEIIYD